MIEKRDDLVYNGSMTRWFFVLLIVFSVLAAIIAFFTADVWLPALHDDGIQIRVPKIEYEPLILPEIPEGVKG